MKKLMKIALAVLGTLMAAAAIAQRLNRSNGVEEQVKNDTPGEDPHE